MWDGRSSEALREFCATSGDLDHADLALVWILASEVGRALADAEIMRGLVALVDEKSGPWPLAIVAQRLRLQAFLGQDGTLTSEEIERLFREAHEAARSWGSGLYDAHISADFGRWLIAQGRSQEGEAFVAQARACYQRLGARRWLNDLDNATVKA